ncbi:hypothetical protein EHQ23_00035 [Leptospira bourretii]|uniref:Uncharacterized protein n=2 Tax=Leptospira bourretii TaxID=2484962 RepID=A0A4R9IGL9_9LEPT|nr:hypothetical protein EHQ26_19825 [Leptospira bourretii]TGK91225.1 hypothetical protein EHQ23_00035 [Leptospira bourretii]TGL41237.1 hypothetical protein EHQ45_02970 [Leptospira bourretii]
MGEIMKGIQKQIMNKDPFPIDKLVIAKGTEYNGTKLTEAITLSASNPKDLVEIKRLMGLEKFPTHAASGMCYSFVNFMNQKANGIEMRSFQQWYIDNVKDGRIGYGETQGGSKGVFEGTSNISPLLSDYGGNQSTTMIASDGVSYGTLKQPLIMESQDVAKVKVAAEQLKKSTAKTALLHIDTGKNGPAGDHHILIIRNDVTGKWETVDHNSEDPRRRGSDPFDEKSPNNLLKEIRRITYVD